MVDETSDGKLVKLALNTPVNVTTVSPGQPVKVTFTKTASTPDLVLSFSNIYYTEGSPSVFKNSALLSAVKKDVDGNPLSFPAGPLLNMDNNLVYTSTMIPGQRCKIDANSPAGYPFCSNNFNLILDRSVAPDTYEFIFYPTSGITKVRVALNTPLVQPL